MRLKRKLYSFNSDFPEIIGVDSEIELVKNKMTFLAKTLRRLSRRIRENQDNSHLYSIYYNQKEVGYIQLSKQSDIEVYGAWLEVDKKYRGNKIATRVLKKLISLYKQQGFKKFSLEVPNNSPDAKHIYKKLGFIETEYLGDDPIWGGLTKMELRL